MQNSLALQDEGGDRFEKGQYFSGEVELAHDLERYKEKALELGATNACLLRTSEIPVEEAVVFKCKIP